ncbi:MAG: hypothetical protein EXQ87_06205 [Alphaproteobacteria bacterium]|nr:hypothetical protein [Alphaproteobacteria bacterium]
MTDTSAPTRQEIERWARRHGIEKLHPEHLDRMSELAVYVADLGRSLRRVASKDDRPAAIFRPLDGRHGQDGH